jgi:hypothetical protein
MAIIVRLADYDSFTPIPVRLIILFDYGSYKNGRINQYTQGLMTAYTYENDNRELDFKWTAYADHSAMILTAIDNQTTRRVWRLSYRNTRIRLISMQAAVDSNRV